MNIRIRFLFGLLLLVCTGYAQSSEWKTFESKSFRIDYPAEWDIDQSGQMNTSVILLSQMKSPQDPFRENVNVIIQDLSAYDIDLDQYVQISENQVKTMITGANIISSERMKKGELEYHKLIYTGMQGILNLQFEQIYYVENNSAYVLTYTAEQKEFKKYQTSGEKILDSFTFN